MKARFPSLPVFLSIALPLAAAFCFLSYLVSSLPSEEDKRIARARDDIRALRSVLLQGEEMPDTKAGLETLILRGDIPFLPKDPWGNPYQYRNPGKAYAYEIFSLGVDGIESQDDIISWNLYGGR